MSRSALRTEIARLKRELERIAPRQRLEIVIQGEGNPDAQPNEPAYPGNAHTIETRDARIVMQSIEGPIALEPSHEEMERWGKFRTERKIREKQRRRAEREQR